ncbi:protein-disulfide reductase DsbD domain-containing protein [Novosphingobium terrae]|uniref:protein-disulfide reductase DsbD domain-containing protein n=1 Tax=Novosphingobium terrae TaxID=2726189 RepID=UPI001980ED26|nr:protein-disulfide reductase DsbD domain-containing protein [Novosphingobium terrae]
MTAPPASFSARTVLPSLPLAALAALLLPGPASAQPGANPTVSWTLAPATRAPLHPGDRVRLVLQGTVREGWHVYAFKQKENGPTPLKVSLEAGDVALADGAPSGSAPILAHDPAFNLDTPYYTRTFAISVPVRLKPHAAAGRQQLPVSVRFQTCNGATCEPPKTLHLTAAVDVAPRG